MTARARARPLAFVKECGTRVHHWSARNRSGCLLSSSSLRAINPCMNILAPPYMHPRARWISAARVDMWAISPVTGPSQTLKNCTCVARDLLGCLFEVCHVGDLKSHVQQTCAHANTNSHNNYLSVLASDVPDVPGTSSRTPGDVWKTAFWLFFGWRGRHRDA